MQVPQENLQLVLLPNSKVPNGVADVQQVEPVLLGQHQRLDVTQLWGHSVCANPWDRAVAMDSAHQGQLFADRDPVI